MYLTKLASVQLVHWNMLKMFDQDPVEVFRKVQLDPALMHQQGARYPRQKITALWEEMSQRIDDPCFGLAAAKCWHPSYFGTLGYAMLMSRTLRITLERLIRFYRVISDVLFAEILEDKKRGALVFNFLHLDREKLSPAREDAVLAWITSVLRMNCQQTFTPVSVSLTHDRPDCAEKYYNFFQSPVFFDASASRLELPLDMVDLVLPSGNEDLAKFHDQMIIEYLADLDKNTLMARVKKIIVEHLPDGNANVKNIASELCFSPRQLQRLLQQEGITFITLLNETRMDLAKQYVQDKNMDLTEIAFLLGFAEQSTFSRSFKRWTGKSPIQYRKVA